MSPRHKLNEAVNELQVQMDWAQQHTSFAKRATNGAETKTSFIKKVRLALSEGIGLRIADSVEA